MSRFEAIVDRALLQPKVEVYGTSSSLSLAFLLTQASGTRIRATTPLVITATLEDAKTFEEDIRFFDPARKTAILPSFDVSPYSGFFPSRKNVADRIGWLYQAKYDPSGTVFIAPIEALMQRTLPADRLPRRSFRAGDELPERFSELLLSLGYNSAPLVEDVGTFALRGGIVDIFTPAHAQPVRIELFGDTIESIRFFDPDTQKSSDVTDSFQLPPAREALYSDEGRERLLKNIKSIPPTAGDELARSIYTSQHFDGADFLVPLFYQSPALPADFLPASLTVWWLSRIDILNAADQALSRLRLEHRELPEALPAESFFAKPEELRFGASAPEIYLTPVLIESENTQDDLEKIAYSTSTIKKLFGDLHAGQMAADIKKYVEGLREEGYSLFIAVRTQSQAKRIEFLLEKAGLHAHTVGEAEASWGEWIERQRHDTHVVHIIPRISSESVKVTEEQLVFLREDDFFDRKAARAYRSKEPATSQVQALTFGDLKPGDYVVHLNHGVGVYDGLVLMDIQGIQSEFIQIRYKDDDKLLLPVYRISQIQRYSSPAAAATLDKLGGTSWKKATIKVRSQLREVASELLKLYAERSRTYREPYPEPDEEFRAFEAFFPYAETEDQLKAIDDILRDLGADKPMDRLICGDVGFGKTEVAMRAAFKVVQSGKQVAVLVPTTTLAIQHLETFKKRFKKWPVTIGGFSRFTGTAEANKNLAELKAGKLDIIIGTHRLFSRDVEYKNLGLLIVDEEQKFGVTHKEKIRKIKTNVDTLTLSATPIPRTLN
ncbi:MAG TPA: DEAD/DEAH box helicase, partial [Bdellovibrionales bacterium]|nr:DEAD/DEAH box helicase [Bdellovibrionales bacterium]